jgi:hypothetical protein
MATSTISVLAVAVALPTVSRGQSPEKPADITVSLETLRQRVLVNEARISLIRMEYKYRPGARIENAIGRD